MTSSRSMCSLVVSLYSISTTCGANKSSHVISSVLKHEVFFVLGMVLYFSPGHFWRPVWSQHHWFCAPPTSKPDLHCLGAWHHHQPSHPVRYQSQLQVMVTTLQAVLFFTFTFVIHKNLDIKSPDTTLFWIQPWFFLHPKWFFKNICGAWLT